MNEFEKVLSEMLDEYGQDPDRMKDSIIAKYGKLIRKQIASEIDVDAMVKRAVEDIVSPNAPWYHNMHSTYTMAVEDTLKEIQEGGK